MKGSNTRNIKFDGATQKIVHCDVCKTELVVGRFAKTTQYCEDCKNIPKGKKDKEKEVVKLPVIKETNSFGTKLQDLALKLDYEITPNRIWRKKYAIDSGGVAVVHLMLDRDLANGQNTLSYFSVTTQRAVGINDDLRKFMPADAASDCEVILSELSGIEIAKPKIGQEKCAKCGALTDEFGVDTNRGLVLCIKPSNCWRKHINGNTAYAESEA